MLLGKDFFAGSRFVGTTLKNTEILNAFNYKVKSYNNQHPVL
jgi:hypothetical protein